MLVFYAQIGKWHQ